MHPRIKYSEAGFRSGKRFEGMNLFILNALKKIIRFYTTKALN